MPYGENYNSDVYSIMQALDGQNAQQQQRRKQRQRPDGSSIGDQAKSTAVNTAAETLTNGLLGMFFEFPPGPIASTPGSYRGG